MRDFGDNLRAAARAARYDSDAEAARAVGVEVRAYGNYVTKGRIPKDPKVLIRMCRVFGTTPNHLFGFQAPGHQQEAAALAERLAPDEREIWLRWGQNAAKGPKYRRRRAA